MRRLVSVILAVLLLFSFQPLHAAADEPTPYPVAGKIGETYLKYGGAAKFGAATSAETKIVVSGRNTYHQHFEDGFVFWSSYQGGKVSFLPNTINVGGVGADRDALARWGLEPETYFRSGKLCNISTAGKQIMNALLHGGTIIDLRTSGAISSCKDPVLVDVNRVNIPVPSHADYVKYVSGSTERAQFAKALTAIANSRGDVWVHCSAGKDRTGWTTMLTMVIGMQDDPSIGWGDIYAEYNRTSGANEDDLKEGLDAVAKKFAYPHYPTDDGANGVLNYIHASSGLYLSEAVTDKIAKKFGRA